MEITHQARSWYRQEGQSQICPRQQGPWFIQLIHILDNYPFR